MCMQTPKPKTLSVSFKQVAHVAVSNPQLVAAEWALGPLPDSQNPSYFDVAPCAGLLAPGQSAIVQV